jgi:tRNA(Arg) A34 adenosine deaminase TadA
VENKQIISRLLSVMEGDILPLTLKSTDEGNKIFGAAILLKSDLSLVVAETNKETLNPLFHGEISCLNKFWELPDPRRPEPGDCIFLSTHEPCSLCLSAITWSGFDNFYYLFSYEDSRDEFNIPHDLKILKEVFKCEHGEYNQSNSYWNSYYILDLINLEEEGIKGKFLKQIKELHKSYGNISGKYQKSKTENKIPLG